MGNSEKKPFQNVDLFIEVPKNIYEAGQTILGNVHFGISSQKQPYQTLTVGFCCKESFLVKAKEEKQVSYQTIEKFTYTKEQVVVNFKENQLPQGQYCFPFEIKLPQNIPSSFSISQSPPAPSDSKTIEIKYIIVAQLNIDPLSKYGSLIKVHTLNILRPFKNSIQPLNKVKIQTGRTCLCFGNSTTSITIFINKNFAITGQKLEINGEVNNANGATDMLTLNCQLIERHIVTNQKKKFYLEKQRGVLHNVKNFKVRKGNIENFSFSYKVPDYLEHSYSIGNYSSLIYFFRFNYEFKDGCNPNRIIQIPIHIQTFTPKLQVNIDQIPSSYEWNPTIKETIKLDTSQNYTYNPEYPLEEVRKTLESHKVDIPSFNYFNQMNVGYPTKQPQPKPNQIQTQPEPSQQQQNYQKNPYYAEIPQNKQQSRSSRKRRIFQQKSNQK